MAIDLKIIKKNNYLHVVGTGEETLENVMETWNLIAKECAVAGIRKVLCESYTESVLSDSEITMDIYTFGNQFLKTGIPLGTRIAVVCKEERRKYYEFANTVISNRGGVVSKIFTELQEAKKWLLENGGKGEKTSA